MYGLFTENGPILVLPNGTATVRQEGSWAEYCAMVFIDQPAGTGWSFTESTAGFVTNEDEVAADLYAFFVQFFQLYPQYQPARLIISAESYGGKYGPAIAYKIIEENLVAPASQYINLWGLSIGDGMMDPRTQTQGMSAAWFQLSIIDRQQMLIGEEYEKRIRQLIDLELWIDAFNVWDEFLNGDFYPYPTFYRNTTGLTSYFNYNTPDYPADPFNAWLNSPEVRQAIHVGDRRFWAENATVEYYLLADWMQSIKHWMPTILNNIHVLLYNGQFDIILAAPQDEDFIAGLVWNGAQAFAKAPRLIWKVRWDDREPSGYIRSAGNFTQAIVRQAGHLVPQDQPLRAQDLIQRFIFQLPWTDQRP